MGRLVERLPWYGWVAVCLLAVIAGGVFFMPPSLLLDAGLTFRPFLVVTAVIELLAAIGIAAIVLHYRDTDSEPSEWRFDP